MEWIRKGLINLNVGERSAIPPASNLRHLRRKTQATSRVISDREFVPEHTFKAPAAKVFAAYTDLKLIPQPNLCISKKARDAMLNYGTAAGAKIMWDRLAQLLAGA